jgi:uncharacterized repeat protein (TIGR04052 family)
MRLARRLASLSLSVTFLLSLSACSKERVPISVEFAAEWGGQPLGCDSLELALTDLRFYVSDLVLTDSQGHEQALRMNTDGQWQQDGVALIDLETGDGACQNGTPQTNPFITGTIEPSDVVSLRFTVGVPFELNHANPMIAEAPLDDSAMHWHWRSGYKFFRAGIGTETDGFWLHLGSTGCEGTVQNISSCRFPNRVDIELSDFSPSEHRIAVDLAALFSGVDLADGLRTDCSSSPAEPTCSTAFKALGLAFDQNENRHEQRVFRVRR